jgi:hypothetical protein
MGVVRQGVLSALYNRGRESGDEDVAREWGSGDEDVAREWGSGDEDVARELGSAAQEEG